MRALLTLLCQYPCNVSGRNELASLLREVKDWPKTVELINAHGIIALAAYNIKVSQLQNEIPETSMALLEDGYMKSVARNAWLTERWKEVNEILTNAGIKHVLLKGMALEHTLYGSMGLRQMNDNDILVSREDAFKTWHLLKGEGFSHAPIKSALHTRILLDVGKHLPTLYKNGYAVEIHHKLFDNNSILNKQSDPIEYAIPFSIRGTEALMLPDEIQTLYLIDHFHKHLQEGSVQLRQYADIILLDKNAKISFPDDFIYNPVQTGHPKTQKKAYREAIMSVPGKHRLRYLAGDIFPSLQWMNQRYGCSGIKTLFYYPQRMGKILWLV
jgi:hypothetical protein